MTTTLGWIVPTCLIIAMLALPISARSADAGVGPSVSGSFGMSVSLSSGNSHYTAFYTRPQWVETGRNMTLSVSFRIDSFTGYKTDVGSFTITASIPVSPQHVLTRTFNSNSSTGLIFLGDTFGPVNLVFPVTESTTGLTPGGETDANVTIGFVWNVFYENPVNMAFPEYAQGTAGQIVIIDGSNQGPSLIPFVAIGAGAACLIAAVYVKRHDIPGQ